MVFKSISILFTIINVVTSQRGGGGGGRPGGKGSGGGTPSPTPSPTSQPSQTPTTPTAPTTPSPTDCSRVRKEWNTATQDERDLYINGLLELSSQGILQKFTQQHARPIAESQAHSTGAFLPWHRLFLYALETEIRNLGDEYRCFSLLYWNWGLEQDKYGDDYEDYIILNSGLGGPGDSTDNYCVTDGSFTSDNYTPYYCTASWESNDGDCCLRRVTGTIDGIYTSNDNEYCITRSSSYGSDDDSWDGTKDYIENGPHAYAHCCMGGCGYGHLGNGYYSPDDPIFYLLHVFVDYLWAVWQDYNDYEKVDKDSITTTIYDGDDNAEIDDELEFSVLVNADLGELTGETTIRDMHSIQDWNYKYHIGSFIDDVDFNTDDLSDDWFVGLSDSRRRRRRRRLGNDEYTETKQFSNLAYQRLKKQYGNETYTKNGRSELVKTLVKLECEFKNTNGKECERPAYFDDCSDMELGDNIYNNQQDINITLDELIEKVKDYPCMVEIREGLYPWVSMVGGLWRLCRGDFDAFCDKEFVRTRPTNGDQCEAKGYEKPEKKEKKQQQSVVFDINKNYGDINKNANNVNNNNNNDMNWNLKEIILFSAVMIMIGLLLMNLFVICCGRQMLYRKDGYNKVKNVDDGNDVENENFSSD